MIRFAPWVWLVLVVPLMAQVVAPPAPTPAPAPTPPPAPKVVDPPLVAPSKVAAPMTAVPMNTCVTADCHPGVKQHRVLHGPVNVDSCDACHKYSDVKQHKFELKREPKQLCTFCHIVDIENAPVVHKPLLEGDCMGCHNPHGGNDLRFLQSETFGPMCVKCHDKSNYNKGFKSVHGPVASGDCGGCHQAHTSTHEKLLVRTGRDLCLGCHQEMSRQLEVMPIKHEPVEKSCLDCHDPHASQFHMVTKAEPLQLCAGTCHEDVRKAVTEAKFKHDAVTEEGGCANCHTPHGGELASLMKDRPVNVCLKCHDKPIEQDGKTIVPAVMNLTKPDVIKHGPVRDGSCGGCHNVHGSDHTRLLAADYPTKFYQPFDVKAYDLCFSCHDRNMVLEPTVERLTNFRDGDRNLHYVHVNRTKRGRTCRACHDTHTSDHAHIIRDAVPYGTSDWELPINYKPTPTGGSCSTGCHQTLRYDRDNPVNDHLPQPEPIDSSPDKPKPGKSPDSKPDAAPDKQQVDATPSPLRDKPGEGETSANSSLSLTSESVESPTLTPALSPQGSGSQTPAAPAKIPGALP